MSEKEKTNRQAAERQAETQKRTRYDREELEPPTLFAWLGSLVTISLILITPFLARGDNPYLRGAGVFSLMLAAVFIFAPFFLLRKHGRTADGKTYMRTRTVVDRGLYAITRHPQYLGYMFLACGFALLSQHWVSFLLAAIGVTLFYFQAVKEEKYCLVRLGEAYAQYLRRVPRFNLILGIYVYSRDQKLFGGRNGGNQESYIRKSRKTDRDTETYL